MRDEEPWSYSLPVEEAGFTKVHNPGRFENRERKWSNAMLVVVDQLVSKFRERRQGRIADKRK